jgi:hypothetical protein
MSVRSLVRLARFAPALLLATGAGALVLALAWWALIFGIMIEASVLTVREAGWCLGDTSGLCRALATLCTEDHPLGLKVYAPELFWLSLALLAASGVAKLGVLAVASTRPSLSVARFRPWHRS